MLPLSLGRESSLGSRRPDLQGSLGYMRPANIASAVSIQRRALVTWLAAFVALAVAIGLGHVWLRLKVVDVGYRLSSTRQVIEKLELEGHELTLEAATLEAPARLEETARLRLGMVRPDKGQEVVLP
jgi:cell division protein FtsL